MILFGHFGITVGAVHAYNKKFKADVDLRKAAIFAELPDILDKPLGVAFMDFFGNRTRLFGHTLLFIVLIALYLKKKKIKHASIFTLAIVGHILLDRIWLKDWDVFLFPVLGIPQPIDFDIFARWHESLYWRYHWAGESIGFTIVMYLFLRYKLYRKENFKSFWNSGVL